jgi:catechol 2,3-dioxygenase-like lactoylglutathione lyase family enzyme
MKLGYTILYVADVAASIDFYENAFGLKRRFIDDSGEYGELDTGETTLSFAAVDLARSNLPYDFRINRPDEPPAGVEVAFITDDVPAAYATAVRAGATPVSEPQTKPWGQTVSYVRDLDGVLVEIASHAE